jgi:short subunit dehydrogenase-like uncharacterized protein
MPEIFTQEETLQLEKATEVRMQIIAKMSDGGIPKDNESIALLLHATDLHTKSVQNNAKIRLSSKANEVSQDMVALMAESLRSTKNKPTTAQLAEAPSLDKNDVPSNMVPGEMDLVGASLSPDQFLK